MISIDTHIVILLLRGDWMFFMNDKIGCVFKKAMDGYSGQINLRMPTHIHESLFLFADSSNKSINQTIVNILERYFESLSMQADQFIFIGYTKLGTSSVLQFQSEDSTRAFNLVVSDTDISNLIENGYTIETLCSTSTFRKALGRFLMFRIIQENNIHDWPFFNVAIVLIDEVIKESFTELDEDDKFLICLKEYNKIRGI